MFSTEKADVMVALVPPEKPTELLVALRTPDGDGMGETEANEVLRHLRGVSFFRPATVEGLATTTYLGTLESLESKRGGYTDLN